MYRKNTASQFVSFQGVDATTGGIKSGVTWTVRRCLDGTFAAGGGTVTEDSTNGWYKYAMSQADTNGNNVSFNFTGTGAVPQTVNIVTTAADPTDATRLGLTALPNAAAGATGGVPLAADSSGRTDVGKWLSTTIPAPNVAGVPKVDVVDVLGAPANGTAIRFTKNTAFAAFDFPMYTTGTNTPLSGLTVTAQRRIDGGSFAACANAVTEVAATGVYTIDLAAADLNGTRVTLKFTAPGADPYILPLVMQG